ncbi:MAG: Replication-associated recombination protein A [Chlamydiae bacterium]|nr:Replication-associated recombination protein A [Chlamydiota bacterium]
MNTPLSEDLRPALLEDVVGQDHLLFEKSFFNELIKEKKPLSLLFWGPPGCGKTTLARIYAKSLGGSFFQFSAVSTSLSDLKELIKKSESQPLMYAKLIIFLDEIHRFNKSQQDFFLPYLESGKFILIGATTENPSFSLNNALLSRMRVFTLNSLSKPALARLLSRYEKQREPLPIDSKAKELLIQMAHGDGRYLLNLIENIKLYNPKNTLNAPELKELLQKRAALFDRAGEGHFNLISALHKSIRGSDPDASVYWLARLLKAGEEPLYISRRLIRAASEDIGLADPQALTYALNSHKTFQILGSPEGEIALAQTVIYLSLAPKSNACYLSYKKALTLSDQSNHLTPPPHILNAPTKLMKEIGYGKGYQYDPDCSDQFSGQNYFPEELQERPSLYHPKEMGQEREMKKRLDYFNALREKK